MSFMEQLKNTIGEEYNESITENGAVGYKTTQHALLDMNFKVSSYRNRSDVEICNDFLDAFREDKMLAMRWLFYCRDARQGLGERRFFRVVMKELAGSYTTMVKKLIPLFAEYGRYDDLMCLIGTAVEDDVIKYIKDTLSADMASMQKGGNVSLLAKWLPSINASSATSKALAKKIVAKLGITEKQYRKMLSKLRTYLNIVEKDMSINNWEAINYEAVPSKANLIYNSAFLRHDESRRRQFLGAVERGEAKINSSVTFPHEIVHKYLRNTSYYSFSRLAVDAGLEALWKALPDLVDGDSSTLVVADGSGSMTTCVDRNSSVSALEVANALAIYFAERCSGQFKNKYITFSQTPQLVNLNGDTLRDNIMIARQHNEVANTNIEATFDLILRTAIRSKMPQSELPKNILIISDMEFDCATRSRYSGNPADKKLFNIIRKRFEENGYTMPRLVFWNVCGRTNTIPVIQNDAGVALVSGFSTNIVKMIMGDETDPYKLLVNTLMTKRYDAVEEALKTSI